jgi:hypothetical protein
MDKRDDPFLGSAFANLLLIVFVFNSTLRVQGSTGRNDMCCKNLLLFIPIPKRQTIPGGTVVIEEPLSSEPLLCSLSIASDKSVSRLTTRGAKFP